MSEEYAISTIDSLISEYNLNGMPIEVDFRKIVHWMRGGDQLTHFIHPYPAKLLPHIASFFLKGLHNSSKVVLDPFSGSGTVALEGSIEGYTPLVADSNPFAILLTKVKTTPYDIQKLELHFNQIIECMDSNRESATISIINSHLWFSTKHKKNLESLYSIIKETIDEPEKDFFLVCFSLLTKKLSYADPALSVPVRIKTKDRFSQVTNDRIVNRLNWLENEASVKEEFIKIVQSNIERVKNTNETYPIREAAKTVGIDARQLFSSMEKSIKLPDDSIPLIITSPPYGSAQKYIRATSLSLNWLEFAKPSDLKILESRFIGREHLKSEKIDFDSSNLPEQYKSLLKKINNINPKRALITFKYLQEMDEVIKELSRVMMKNGKAVFVIGNNEVCGETLRNDMYIIYCFEKYNVKLELFLVDDIKSRGLMTKRNRAASVISRESVLLFSKE